MQAELENLLLEVSKSRLIDLGDMQQAEELIINSLLRGLQIQRAGVWMLDKEVGGIRCNLIIDLFHQTRDENIVLTREKFPHYFKALDKERTIAADNALTHPATKAFAEIYLKPMGIGAMLDIPIRHRGKMVGIVCCEHIGGEKQWNQDEQSFAAAMADLVGRAISAKERNDYARQLEETNASLEKLVHQRTASLEQTLDTLKQAQNQLIENEKMASLGSLVSGVAHEVNTPLGIAVTGASHCQHLLSQLREKIGDNQLTRSALDLHMDNMDQSLSLVTLNLDRAAELVQNFKKTAVDQHNLALTEFELGEYIQVVMSSLLPMLKKHQVNYLLKTECKISMRSYPGALAQILTNLTNNACLHAFDTGEDGNELVIEVRQTLQQNKEYAVIRFHDNGRGMAKEVLKSIFLPFFTTRRGLGGSGLGLSISYNLASAKLKGKLEAGSEPQQGTTFTLTLPCHLDE
ncbi:ATP-binding protein [Lacimicrobium alkaliphilum]|uniref:histidine kinase n=1 Tax=Lacimicrobium alkaliphilum TaxID=1526571 RepID=A0ABQ1RBK4_9ALTE|nr:ATP-binding protein [Lacimicrobium alkaliphilum]GGD65020.1 diguanylate cyclase [Lacimicrobium alkaliphilum]